MASDNRKARKPAPKAIRPQTSLEAFESKEMSDATKALTRKLDARSGRRYR